jgi:MFS superfamily sulfate permease-like transporter
MDLQINKSTLLKDLIAGLTFALVNIPQSMAHALLATVNPVLGLYTLMVVTPVGAIFTSATFMNVSTTSALSVAAGGILVNYPPSARESALVTLVLLIGIFQVVLGVQCSISTAIFSMPRRMCSRKTYQPSKAPIGRSRSCSCAATKMSAAR